MKKRIGIVTGAVVLCGGIALAQNGAPKATGSKSAPAPSATAGSSGASGHEMMSSGSGMQGSGMMGMHGSGMMGGQGPGATGGGMMGMGSGMMGSGMMGDGMMESCSCSADAKGVHVEVKKLPKGVSVTYTSEDASAVVRIQKRAEAVRLMHESCSP